MNAPLILHCCANTKNIICVFRESNNISIRIRSFLESRIVFVFVFGLFGEPNNIRIRSFLEARIIFVFVFGQFWKAG